MRSDMIKVIITMRPFDIANKQIFIIVKNVPLQGAQRLSTDLMSVPPESPKVFRCKSIF